jgi:hypothetical protein
MRAALNWIHNLGLTDTKLPIAVWGVSMTEGEALRLQAGVRGNVRITADLENILSCLRTFASARSWMEDCAFRDSVRQKRYPRSELIPRKHQLLEWRSRAFKNKEIRHQLGIQPGTSRST